MTIDEWIEFAETKAKEHRERYTTCADDPEWVKYGKIWEKEYQQLAEWLRELKAYREDRHSCESCEYEYNSEHQLPCSECSHNFKDRWEWRGEEE